MRMVDFGGSRSPLHIITTPTTVDCTKEIRFRRSFRSIVGCMVPCCRGFQPSDDYNPTPIQTTTVTTTGNCTKEIGFRRTFRSIVGCMVPCNRGFQLSDDYNTTPIQTTTVTATFFGYRRGRVSFCLQDPSQASALLLLDFAIPIAYLAHEMRHGLLRIALKSTRRSGSGTIFGVPVWTTYCNGRKVGFAVRREMSDADTEIFKLMQSVTVGGGVLPGESKVGEGDLMYLRARFERVTGSVDSESFHMINPAGSVGQELSIFLLRS